MSERCGLAQGRRRLLVHALQLYVVACATNLQDAPRFTLCAARYARAVFGGATGVVPTSVTLVMAGSDR